MGMTIRSAAYMLLILLGIFSCKKEGEAPAAGEFSRWVDPFIGTGAHGHTFPGATTPFGMVQLSPDTRLTGWDGCGGYHYTDDTLYGFSHTHLSGTGVSDYGDILVMPFTGETPWTRDRYKASFSHEKEAAHAGYYQVDLTDRGIRAELTATPRCGVHRYVFPKGESARIIIDLEHRDRVLSSGYQLTDEGFLLGHRHSAAWAEDQRLFFALQANYPIQKLRSMEGGSLSEQKQRTGKSLRVELTFGELPDDTLELFVALSAVDEQGALNNLREETTGLSFARAQRQAEATWNEALSKVQIDGVSDEQKTIFYTALYHTMIAPNLYSDVDGRFRNMDLAVHRDTSYQHYTVFSLWDTYRATHPLFTLIEQERTVDFIKTMLDKYEAGGILPIWDLSANYTGCMIGYHGIPVIADAYLKGIRGYDDSLALAAMLHSAMQDHLGLGMYKMTGFIPVENESESVSKTLEYAYDDWCIARMAGAMGDSVTYRQFIKRAQGYKHLFDPYSGFFRGRLHNRWFSPFDPAEVNFNYTEANAWQYAYYVPHDMSGLMKLHGGPATLTAHIDNLFNASSETSGREQPDITGMIGQYAHGNEPSHHIAYLYNFTGFPAKTQVRVREIAETLYTAEPDGIPGNEDCGQMSSWYIFASAGMYPVTPGSNQYILSTPLAPKVTWRFENGKTLEVETRGDGQYIAGMTINGEVHTKSWVTHEQVMAGGKWVFETTSDPDNGWATAEEDRPITSITEELITPAPFISKGEPSFYDSTTVALDCADPFATLYVGRSGGFFDLYRGPFTQKKSETLAFYADGSVGRSPIVRSEFIVLDSRRSITLGAEYANQYSAGGDLALIDGRRGGIDFRTGAWQGYQGQDLVATVDLGSVQRISRVDCGFLQDQKSWILLPSEVKFEGSTDGTNWVDLGTVENNIPPRLEQPMIKRYGVNPQGQYRYIRMTAKTFGELPEWHLGAEHGGESWLFADEIGVAVR
jgi:predicted alpha-1,2-mannosidase